MIPAESARPLGRLEPTDFRHLLRYPITAATLPRTSVPLACGWDWHRAFDDPWEDSEGNHWLVEPAKAARPELWGPIRGGHEICLKPPRMVDRPEWWRLFDQGVEGACVGFAFTRTKTLMERIVFDPWWLYRRAQEIDEWPGEDYQGTSGRAAGDVLRTMGHRRWKDGAESKLIFGVQSFRWGRSVEDGAYALDPRTEGRMVLNRGWAELLNSWGERGYPHITRVPLETIDILTFRRYGDMCIVVDQ